MTVGRFALAVAGAPSAGKTTLAREIAARTGARRVAFGDYVRIRAADAGRATSRDVLQQLGQDLLDELGPEGLCRAALESAGGASEERPVVWDGVRHLSVCEALYGMYGSDLALVYLDPPGEARRARLARQAASDEQLSRWERDATEAEHESLKRAADLICTAVHPEQAADEVLAFVQSPVR